jgi:hypothetical protein
VRQLNTHGAVVGVDLDHAVQKCTASARRVGQLIGRVANGQRVG